MRIGHEERGVLTIDLRPDGGELMVRTPDGGHIYIGVTPSSVSVLLQSPTAGRAVYSRPPEEDTRNGVTRLKAYIIRRDMPLIAPIASDVAVTGVMLSEGWLGSAEQMARAERRAPDGSIHPVLLDNTQGQDDDQYDK